jgi:hypothetical protein
VNKVLDGAYSALLAALRSRRISNSLAKNQPRWGLDKFFPQKKDSRVRFKARSRVRVGARPASAALRFICTGDRKLQGDPLAAPHGCYAVLFSCTFSCESRVRKVME